MESSLAEILNPWLMRVETVDWASPQSRRPSSIRDFQYRRPCIELLEAAMAYWDPTMHTFRFHEDEMCPTVEEFQAYLPGFSNLSVLAIPPFQEDMNQLLRAKLNIPEELSSSIIQNGELNIIRLIELYGPEGALGNYVGEAHKRFVLSICALAAYMLIPADGKVNPSLVSVALQMDARKDIMPVVLEETFMGLDMVKYGQANSFSGCPLMLQLWLSNKVGVLEAPEASFEDFPRRLVERPMLFPEQMVEEWFAFLNDMHSEDIVWRCPWLNLPEMIANSVGFNRVIIAGLTSFTFYIPGRTICQLGMNQGNQRFGTEDIEIPGFDAWNLHCCGCSWNNRDLKGSAPDLRTWLESRYVKWLHREVEARLGGFF